MAVMLHQFGSPLCIDERWDVTSAAFPIATSRAKKFVCQGMGRLASSQWHELTREIAPSTRQLLTLMLTFQAEADYQTDPAGITFLYQDKFPQLKLELSSAGRKREADYRVDVRNPLVAHEIFRRTVPLAQIVYGVPDEQVVPPRMPWRMTHSSFRGWQIRTQQVGSRYALINEKGSEPTGPSAA
jgi:hypothetical protein